MEDKRGRCPNFGVEEVDTLVNLAEKYKNVIECKKTDQVNNLQKEKAWMRLAADFNAICESGRTGKMLRSKWDSLKKSKKREFAEHKRSLYKTGGGPAASTTPSTQTDLVLSIIGVGATGTENGFDSDKCFENSASEATSAATSVAASASTSNELGAMDWGAWNPAQLKSPVHHCLKVAEIETEGAPEAVNEARTHTRGRKKTSDNQVYNQVMQHKPVLLQLQIKILQDEADRKERRLQEKHEVEMQILAAELANKTKTH